MPNLDSCYPQVVSALQKDGWIIKPRPLTLEITKTRRLLVDIEAYDTNNNVIMIVEVKCFQTKLGEINDLYTAIGQYLVYRALLKQHGLSNRLYLAIPYEAYQNLFRQLAMSVIEESGIKMILIDLDLEEIVEWVE